MDPSIALQDARRRSGLTQAELADRAGTSQATVSAYEAGRKQPSISTFNRLLAASGARLEVEPSTPHSEPSPRELERAGRLLAEVLALAERLPARPSRLLRFPRLDRLAER